MTTNTGVYCTAPFNGLTIREDGIVRTCCVGNIPLGNLNEVSIDSIEASPALRQIQESMLTGVPNVENCKGCINSEAVSMPSLRNYYNQYYKNYDLNKLKLKVIDIRWNNFCNLRCMYCGPHFSSMWETIKIKKKTNTVKQYQDHVADWIIKKIDDVQELMLVGGEPMLMEQNYDLISNLPTTAKLSIVTNLSYDLENLPRINQLLTRPKENTLWNISLENTNEQFEYTRQLASWNQIEKNLIFLNKHWENIVSVNFVYSMFSAFEIDETIKKLHSYGIEKFNFFGIQDNETMNVLSMPKEIKSLASKKLIQAIKIHKSLLHPDDIDFCPFKGADTILSALLADTPCSISKKAFNEKIQWYDQWSERKFKDLWPNVMELVDLHLE